MRYIQYITLLLLFVGCEIPEPAELQVRSKNKQLYPEDLVRIISTNLKWRSYGAPVVVVEIENIPNLDLRYVEVEVAWYDENELAIGSNIDNDLNFRSGSKKVMEIVGEEEPKASSYKVYVSKADIASSSKSIPYRLLNENNSVTPIQGEQVNQNLADNSNTSNTAPNDNNENIEADEIEDSSFELKEKEPDWISLREWTDIKGRKMEAAVVYVQEKINENNFKREYFCIFRKPNGEKHEYPVLNLSKPDRLFIKELMTKKGLLED